MMPNVVEPSVIRVLVAYACWAVVSWFAGYYTTKRSIRWLQHRSRVRRMGETARAALAPAADATQEPKA